MSNKIVITGMGAVSYTHLDVYKRQRQNIFNLGSAVTVATTCAFRFSSFAACINVSTSFGSSTTAIRSCDSEIANSVPSNQMCIRDRYTRVTSVKSPWLSGVNAGDVFTVPVSHGEGRFVASDAVMQQLIENGQVAFQYTTPCGKPSGDVKWNPKMCIRDRS